MSDNTEDGWYYLSRLNLFEGIINEKTPNVVIYEVAHAHGINVSSEAATFNNKTLLKLIAETPVEKVKPPYTSEMWRYLARYVNSHVNNWKNKQLKDAFLFLYQSPDLKHLCPNFRIGEQTPEHPFSINACLLYKICLKYNINTFPEMTYQEMGFVVNCLKFPREVILNMFITQSSHISSSQLINTFLHLSRQEINSSMIKLPNCCEEISHEGLEKIHHEMVDLKCYQTNYIPRSTIEAVALAALKYNLDISSSEYPFYEYYRLIKDGHNSYQPYDSRLAHYYSVNPRLYLLEYHFNPLFPESYYPLNLLADLQIRSGYDRLPMVNTYSQLSEIYLCNTFYHGLRPDIINKESPFDLDNLDNLQSNEIICYGNPNDGCTFFSYSELADYFKANKAYLHPLEKGKQLTKEEKVRLRYLVEEINYPHDNEYCALQRRKLLDVMIYVDTFDGEITHEITKFVEEYNYASIQIQQKIRDSFEKMFMLSMYMRGWEGGSEPYPLQEAPYKEQGNVDLHVTEALISWEVTLVELGNIWSEKIRTLPIFMYRNGFVVSTDERYGLTIGDKINLVKNGENSNNVAGSCIRVSSGWLAASAYRYLSILGFNPIFDISKLNPVY